MRAPTPSAAAELVIESKHQLNERVAGLHIRLSRAIRYRLLTARSNFVSLAQHAAFTRIKDLFNRRQQRLDELTYKLAVSSIAQHRAIALAAFRRRFSPTRA